MKRFLIFAACVSASLASISVLSQAPQGAQAPQGQPSPRRRGGFNVDKRMKRMDTNNDGVISRDEWKGKPEGFDKIDKNGDGSLTREELEAAARRQAGRFDQMDTNNDGRISRDEWKGPPKRFDRLDVNGDGVLTKEEIRSVRQNRQKNQ
ncbi:MAG: EF-hand domain-containing protein [Blastocatellia bacterium]|nr:EF-hand domain-containing protein [Blastocatellia bacterium]